MTRRGTQHHGEIRKFKVVDINDPDIPRYAVVDWFGKISLHTDDKSTALKERDRLNRGDLSLRTAGKR